ncbi:MAG: hypothetical protein LLF76_04680 [Planctomycetaceae bacterium]|nr:hypothetical protein [Planctomycetaceae bacterium]
MSSQPENQERLFEADQDRIDFELYLKLQHIEQAGLTAEYIELSAMLEHLCGFSRFDANRIAADETLLRYKRKCVIKLFMAATTDILNAINPAEAVRRIEEQARADADTQAEGGEKEKPNPKANNEAEEVADDE